MRRLTIGFTVVVLVLPFASVAGAAPPDTLCDDKPNHPQCTTTLPPSTTTTTTTAPPELEVCPNEMTIVGKATTSFECLWKPVNNGSETATVTVSNITGAIPGPPTVFVRDDSPGDICLLTQADDDWLLSESGYEASFDLIYHSVPVPTSQDPDVPDYSAWLGQSYWDFVWQPGVEPGTHWCAPQDPVLDSLRYDTNGGALHFMVNFNAKKGGSLHITLFPKNSL